MALVVTPSIRLLLSVQPIATPMQEGSVQTSEDHTRLEQIGHCRQGITSLKEMESGDSTDNGTAHFAISSGIGDALDMIFLNC